ncbi:MAG: hypothetical protein KatS3mg060_1853 [Dehalococcoidia bacterium]|nr:MAG: hypothetical protein KatS3mg060_1853 [Dehalococcoidia bacterium]
MSVELVQTDPSDWDLTESIDIALCFYLSDYLYDDEMGNLLTGLRKKLSSVGRVVLGTALALRLPARHNGIWVIQLALTLLVVTLRTTIFDPIVISYEFVREIVCITTGRKVMHERINYYPRYNSLKRSRVCDLFQPRVYELLHLENGYFGDSHVELKDLISLLR